MDDTGKPVEAPPPPPSAVPLPRSAGEDQGRPLWMEVADGIAPVETRIALLILQHPQEQDKELGTARLTAANLTNAVFRVGLSWPSLAKALGRPADPKRWAVLHLGSARPADFPPGAEIAVLDKQGKPAAGQRGGLAGIEGVVVLDGTWSQAKTLWWRNPWVLKARRIAIRPRRPSLYGKLRREPRREGLATIEAAGLVLARLEQRPEIETALAATFARLLDRYRANKAASSPHPPPAHPRASGDPVPEG